jgi:hypothetical protein
VPATTKTSKALVIVNAWISRPENRATREIEKVSYETVARILLRTPSDSEHLYRLIPSRRSE